MRYREGASFGKRQEFIAVAELLKRNFDVYLTLVDDQQIDCIIRLSRSPPIYIDVQIKARAKDKKNAASFSDLNIKSPRPNYFYIFYVEATECYWVMPSLNIVKEARSIKSGNSAGNFKLDFANQQKDGSWKPRPKWKEYENSFHLLEEYENNLTE
jgi:hypothetical protein